MTLSMDASGAGGALPKNFQEGFRSKTPGGAGSRNRGKLNPTEGDQDFRKYLSVYFKGFGNVPISGSQGFTLTSVQSLKFASLNRTLHNQGLTPPKKLRNFSMVRDCLSRSTHVLNRCIHEVWTQTDSAS